MRKPRPNLTSGSGRHDGAAIYGGLVAKKLGLIEIDVQKVLAWISKYIVCS